MRGSSLDQPTSPPAPVLRLATPEDYNFIRSAWVQSYCRMVGSRFFEAAALFPDKTELRAGEWALAGKLLERSAVPLLEETNEKGKRIIAFAVIDSEFAVLHYAFVAESERRKGHLKRLIAPLLEETWSYTRVTPTGRAVGTKLGGKFQPYRLYDILGG